jgi:hypothetical protein
MGSLRFRKQFRLAPGVKLTLNKHSMSFTGGVRGAHLTYNTKGYRTTSVGLPSTGLSYRDTRKVGRRRGPGRREKHPFLQLLAILLIVAFVLRFFWWIVGAAAIIVLGYWCVKAWKRRTARIAALTARLAEIAARADQQHKLIMEGDPRGAYGEYPPAQLGGPDAGEGLTSLGRGRPLDGEESTAGSELERHVQGDTDHQRGSAIPGESERVSRVGKPRLWRDDPECDGVTIQLNIWPTVPDPRWWGCFQKVAQERQIRVGFGSVSRGGIATRAENPAAVPSAVAAIDSAIDYANDLFERTIARDEADKRVKELRAARLEESQAELDMVANKLEKPDPA